MLRLRRDHKIAVLKNGARLPSREGAGLGAARPTPLDIYEIKKNQEREDNDMKKVKRQILTLMMALMVMFIMMPNTVEAAAKKNDVV